MIFLEETAIVPEGETVVLLARPTGPDGQIIDAAFVKTTSATGFVFRLFDESSATPDVPVFMDTGTAPLSLSATGVIYDDIQQDGYWTRDADGYTVKYELKTTSPSAAFTVAGQPAVGETITVDDGLNTPIVYEFGGVGGNVNVTIAGTALETMNNWRAAMLAQYLAQATLVGFDNQASANVVLYSERQGAGTGFAVTLGGTSSGNLSRVITNGKGYWLRGGHTYLAVLKIDGNHTGTPKYGWIHLVAHLQCESVEGAVI